MRQISEKAKEVYAANKENELARIKEFSKVTKFLVADICPYCAGGVRINRIGISYYCETCQLTFNIRQQMIIDTSRVELFPGMEEKSLLKRIFG